ncbi:MAG: alpha-ribazole phosphatase [Acidobacteria bacterium]|nr:alpha-ribazole phosphatase [Acidobacteriota bacterium]
MARPVAVQPTKVWLIRHGEPEDSARGHCYGSLDVGLSAEGERQIQAVASKLSGEPWAAIYTSPRLRCLQSARILAAAHCCPIEPIDALSEIDFGEFEGHTYDEIAIRYPDLYRQWMEHPTEVCFPRGETFNAMWTRVTEAASAVRTRHLGQCIAFVTHGGVIRILLADALGIPRPHIFRIAQRYAAVNLISYFEVSSVVELLNFPAGTQICSF